MLRSFHGGDIYSEDIKLDFSVNVNPLGCPDSVKKEIISHMELCEQYPDIEMSELKNAISRKYSVPPKNILCGNGAGDLIFRVVQAVRPKKAMLVSPTFSEYENALKTVDCDIEYFTLSEENNFSLKAEMDEFLHSSDDIEMLFICNPNNPTGESLSYHDMQKIILTAKEKGIYLVVDECFTEFVSEEISVRNEIFGYDRLIIIDAFTKSYAMAGLRLGIMFCRDEKLILKMAENSQPWAVSSLAQRAGVIALDENDYIVKMQKIIEKERAFLTENLKNYGIKVFESDANFILIKAEKDLDKKLKSQGILIRNCNNFKGLNDGFFRIAVRKREENKMLIDALRRIYG